MKPKEIAISMKYYLVLLFSIFLVSTGCQSEKVPSANPSLSDSELLQDLSPDQIQEVTQSPFEGITLVNVWATWCAPCIKEFPYLIELQNKYPQDLRILFISADFPEDRDRALQFLKDQQVNWPTYLKTGRDLEFISALSEQWSGSIPFTQYYLPDGSVFTQWSGEADLERFEREFLLALEQI
jgi:thiol-disulfide isomerase/thioredoxin